LKRCKLFLKKKKKKKRKKKEKKKEKTREKSKKAPIFFKNIYIVG
jgi:hypothetical protein